MRKVDAEDQINFLALLQYFQGEQCFDTMLRLTTEPIEQNCYSNSEWKSVSHMTHIKIENNTPICFLHYRNKYMYDPEWVELRECPPGILNDFLSRYHETYKYC